MDDKNFFSGGPLHVSCMGWEVEIDMSGHSSHHLRVRNVKMKKFSTGAEMGHISVDFQLTGP